VVTLLPIVSRELRVASRKRMTYWSRFGTAIIAFGAFIWVWLSMARHATNSQRGMMLFSVISGAAFLFALIAGAAITADCISEEKRDGTLGLLFLTDLRGYDVVFGKLFATSIDSFYRLVAVFPILAIPVMMGGVAPEEVGRVVLVLLNTLFLSLCLGIFFSSISRDDRRARALTGGVLLFLTLGVPALCAGYAAYYELRTVTLDLMIFSPGFGFFTAFTGFYKPNHFWGSLLFCHGLSWASLIVASFILPHVWQDKAKSKKGEKLQKTWDVWRHGTSEQRAAFRSSLLDTNAVYWLGARDRLKPAVIWLFLGLAGALWFWLFVRWPDDMLEPEIYVMTAVIINTCLKFWVASEAPRLFGRDKKSGALELLLSTPMSVPSILRGQLLALWRHFGWQITVVFALELLMMTAALVEENFDGEFFLLWFVGLTMFLLDIVALAVLGMWHGLRAKTVNAASGQVVARILILPWFLFFSFITFFELSDLDRSLSMDEEEAMLFWLAIGICINAYFTIMSWRNLVAKFREIATQRFDKSAGWRWFGWFRPKAQ